MIYQVDIESENEDEGPSCEYIEIEDSKSFHQLSPELLKTCQPALQDAVIMLSDSDSEVGLDGNIYEKQGYVIKCPKLRKLCIRDLFVNRGPLYFDLLLKPLQGKKCGGAVWC